MKRYARGLVVGKFCPLHYGHEHVIDTALDVCDELFVLGYTRPEFDGCEPAERRRWFGLRYPASRAANLHVLILGADEVPSECARRGVSVPAPAMPCNDDPEEHHREFCGWICRELFGGSVDAVFTSEAYGEGFAASLARQFGHPVDHVAVDPARAQVPASGTALRRDPRAGRSLMAPEVYASLVPRIALMGGESSGKTVLAHAVAQALGTVTVEEYGRELWVEQGGAVLSYEDLQRVAEVQVEREYRAAALAPAGAAIVCDTTPLTTLFYSLKDHGAASSRLLELSRRRYTLNVLCEPDFPFVQDGTRRDAAFRAEQHAWYLERLSEHDAKLLRVEGSLASRVDQVLRALR
ncbi:NadR type nicotinamide-nucleotide adenylyltransferase [Panacagrimonas perspica]|uniref:NadR type nicotinamide-nucleotide adenylyltransferase n=1 Tax=Panacagrimonas perspica TaxID=381431 RepID=A0A4R7PDQ8_9GAMM|nr:AAA family ATPase [Panacagrimonas perspica]TDU32324.1 NadR type nicotinamide-nucleotide adenylyltransferase [Panacagrimonas perspica]THD05262.1 hypothetical protein B1810_00475 [Panacagrimonas perspica]